MENKCPEASSLSWVSKPPENILSGDRKQQKNTIDQIITRSEGYNPRYYVIIIILQLQLGNS